MVKKELQFLRNLVKEEVNKYSVIFINGDKDYNGVLSGYLEEYEQKEIDQKLSLVSKNYYFYNNPSTFVGDIILNRIDLNTYPTFIYSTAQIGLDINRRSFIPNFSSLYNIHSLSSGGYQLSLMQNKYHYYQLAKEFCRIPKTYIYRDSSFDFSKIEQSKKWIIKPNLECSAKGVKLIKDIKELKNEVVVASNIYRQDILIQEYIVGREIEIPVLISKNKVIALPPINVNKSSEYLSQEIIDTEKYSFSILQGKICANLQKTAEEICTNLEARGLCRIDFILDSEENFWLFDIAALPLISTHSSCYVAFRDIFPNDDSALYESIIGAGLSWLV
ncbi:MAG: ATP-grasp domain-containing protein [Streptococcaceae bacterium]|jgi:D-alanine-D-alanine ligase|nr:ATP-grasp domain-containing protein [Streptococcaceae bacterium]